MSACTDYRWKRLFATGALLVAVLLALAGAARGQMQAVGVRPELLKDVGIDQKLNNQVPLNLEFRDEKGRPVQLGKYFEGKPVILSLVYYQCPMLCTQVLNGLLQGLKDLPMDVGKQFEVITVSIDPRDNTAEAEAKQIMYTGLYGRPSAVQGWHFLTGKDVQIHELADAVGFRYAFDAQSGQYAHASAIMVLTPEGKVSRYFYGIDFPARELRLGLVEASANKIGSPVDQILLYCYHYDPATGKYGVVIANVLRAAAAFTVFAIGLLIYFLTRYTHDPLPGKRA
jgi:protein SCO1/2